jgi:hypothetical protein
MVQTRDEFPLFGPARNGWVQCGIQDHFSLLKRCQVTKVAKELKEPEIPRQVRFADAAKYPQVRLEQ